MTNHSITTNSLWPERKWWFALLLVLVCTGVLRYTGYDFSLPYIESSDEVRPTLLAQDIVLTGKIETKDTRAPYSLGLVGVHYALLSWFYSSQEPPSTVLLTVRAVSITVSLLSIVLLGLLAYRLAGAQAGLAASALWAVLPANVGLSRTGAADNFTTFSMILALFLVLWGTYCQRTGWILLSSVGVMLATLFNSQSILLMPLWLVIPLWQLRDAQANSRRTVVRGVSDLLFLFVLFLVWLLWLSPVIISIQMGRWNETLWMLTPATLIQNIRISLTDNLKSFSWILGMIGLGWFFLPQLRRRVWLFGMVTIAVCAIIWALLVSVEPSPDSTSLMLSSALFCIVSGIGLTGWVAAFQRGIERAFHTDCTWMSDIATLILVIIGTMSQIQTSIMDARQHTLHDRRNDLAAWADTTLEGANHIADSTNDRVLNASFGGYRGLSMFPMVETALVTDRPLAEWRSQGVTYAIMSYDAYEQMQVTHIGQSYLNQVVLLKQYPPSPYNRDPGMVVVRLYPIQHSMDAALGSIHLIGYELNRVQLAPGEALTVRYYWRATQPTQTIYRVFNHLIVQDSIDPVAQIDGPPLLDLRRPTTLWNDPQETILSQAFVLTVGSGVNPGIYRLVTGFYDPETGQRLLAPNGDSLVRVTTIQVMSR